MAASAVGLLLGGCADQATENRPVQSRVALTAAASCEQLEQRIEDTAVSQMRADLLQLRNHDMYRGGGPIFAPAAPESDASGAAGPSDYTTTNTQVAGVDEADFIKNDGTRIFALSRNRLVLSQSWPAESLGVKGTLEIEGYPNEMFLDGDRVVVFSGIYEPVEGGGVGFDRAAACWMGFQAANKTKVTTVDVSDLAAPRVVGEVYLPGRYTSSRRIDQHIRLVLADQFRQPKGVAYYPEADERTWNDEGRWKAAIDQLIEKNEKLIRAQTLEAWIPTGSRKLADGTVLPLEHACSDFQLSDAPSRLGMVTVATLDMDAPEAQIARTSVVGEVGTIYASPTALYVTSPHWWWMSEPGQVSATYVHKFDISSPERAVYRGSGTLEGTLSSQFNLDEKDGFLRAATTIQEWRVTSGPGGSTSSADLQTRNRVTVLAEQGGALVVKGKTGDLAPGETIYAARFMGNRGFVVTYRQVDPLFTIDLSDPANPRVLGELKIPGFSTYLHPVDENHLIGMGEDRDEDGSWRSRRLKVSLYDVSDLKRPVEKFKHLIGGTNSYSDAAHDHKAFNYFAAKKTLAIPYTDYGSGSDGAGYWSRFTSELQVLSVDTATGFTRRGSLSFNDVYASYGYSGWSYFYQPNVRRSVMADDYVYAISDAGIRVAHVDSLSTPIATANFTRHWPADGSL